MGTNYYAIPKATDDVKLKIIEAVVNNQMEQLKRLVPTQIHLGKSSGGWMFLFNHNNWEYYKTVGELGDFIDKCEITDEYGKTIEVKEFKELVEEKQKIGTEKYTSSQWADHYIIKDGYVFSTSTEFS